MKAKKETDDEFIARVIGAEIKKRRINMGISQTELGEQLKISFQQVQKYERGTNRLPVIYLVKLSSLYRCSVEDLLPGVLDRVSHMRFKI